MQVDPRLPEIVDCLYRVAVKAVIVEDKKLLLVIEKDDEFWSLPGGGVEYGESVLEALGRELEEELGVPKEKIKTDSKVVHVNIGSVHDGIPKANLYYTVELMADIVSPTKDVVESKWFTVEEIEKLELSPSMGGSEGIAKLLSELDLV